MDAVCTLDAVGKRYGDHVVLDAFSLAVERGEMVAITGPSGAGKTTVLNVMGLLERPSSGTVTLFGKTNLKIRSRVASRLLRTHLAYLFQNYALIDDTTVDANLEVALAYQRAPRRERTARKRAALAQVGLDVPLRQRIYALSGGEQQRVAIARLLLKPCELMLADEPTGSLDAANRDTIVEILQELNKGGKTIVIVTHDPEVYRRCHRSVALAEQ
ncbi:MAG: ABC transporter ATP-binding protein [Acidimicrobiales bacterium]